jgi:two-component system, OmpR family, response regulator VicR
MKGRVLIVEDELELAELIQMYLQKDGIESAIKGNGESALEAISEEVYDLIVLDINLPGIDGFELLQKIRAKIEVPVIIASAREADEDIIMALGAGADEFVTKPFAPRVFVARVRALLRRSRTEGGRAEKVFGPFRIDMEGYLLRRGEDRIGLSSKEFEVLRYLVQNPGKAMTPDEIYAGVWNNEYGDSTSVAVYIRRIRQKVEDNPRAPVFIQTIHGKGYRFNPEALGGPPEAI